MDTSSDQGLSGSGLRPYPSTPVGVNKPQLEKALTASLLYFLWVLLRGKPNRTPVKLLALINVRPASLRHKRFAWHKTRLSIKQTQHCRDQHQMEGQQQSPVSASPILPTISNPNGRGSTRLLKSSLLTLCNCSLCLDYRDNKR